MCPDVCVCVWLIVAVLETAPQRSGKQKGTVDVDIKQFQTGGEVRSRVEKHPTFPRDATAGSSFTVSKNRVTGRTIKTTHVGKGRVGRYQPRHKLQKMVGNSNSQHI